MGAIDASVFRDKESGYFSPSCIQFCLSATGSSGSTVYEVDMEKLMEKLWRTYHKFDLIKIPAISTSLQLCLSKKTYNYKRIVQYNVHFIKTCTIFY